MKFDWNTTGPMVELGKKDAAAIIKLGEGQNFKLY
jgi:hypothetical protein